MGVNVVKFYGTTIIDLTGATVTPETLGAGVTAYDSKGNLIVGTAEIVVKPAMENLADPTSSDWVNNSRLGSDGNAKAEGSFSGGVVTNWFDCKRGDVIRFKGIELTKAYATSNTTAPYMSIIYTNGTKQTFDINSYESGFPRDSNGVYTFTVLCSNGSDQSWTTNGEVQKIRVSGLLSAADASGVIITKNHEITS